MDELEMYVAIFCAIMAFVFFGKWYRCIGAIWPPDRGLFVRKVFWALPVAAGAVMFFTLNSIASFDVTDSFTFAVLFYIPLGYALTCFGLAGIMRPLFDIDWHQDAVNNGNKAAVPAVVGGYMALVAIYSGANVGDGPGWWCVIFACGLGYAAWFLLWMVFGEITGTFERVTIDRDFCCGIRLCCYFIATGIVLARASAGDYTSVGATIEEFADGWLVLPLMAAMAGAELLIYHEKADHRNMAGLPSSITAGVFFIVIAVLAVVYVIGPPRENPMYDAEAREMIDRHSPADPERRLNINIHGRNYDLSPIDSEGRL